MYEITKGRIPTAKKVVLYGVEGIGKTSFAAKFPDPVFIDTEGGSKSFDVARFPDPLSWQMLLDEVRSVINNPSICKTLVIDTLDWAEKLAYEHVCAVKKWDSIETPGYGAGYRYAYEEMGKLLNLLSQVVERGVNVVLIAHAALRKFEQPDEMGSYDRWEMKLQTSAKCNTASMVREHADMVLFANYETIVVKNENKKGKAQGGQRVMYTAHHPCWDAKNRFDLPEKLPLDYEKVAHCFLQPAANMAPDAPQAAEESADNPAERPSIDSAGIPAPLLQLMQQYGIQERDIQRVVAMRGYYPESTPIRNYDPQFVEGVLVGAWQQVYNMIKGA